MTPPAPGDEPFLSRWSRLKRSHAESADAAPAVPLAQPAVAPPPDQPAAATQLPAAEPATTAAGKGAAPSLPSIDSLTIESDYAQFFQPKVPEALRRAAVKKLFADPHFNVMDGLDTYIDDYSRSDPIPPEMLAQLVQAREIIDHPSNRKPEDAGSGPPAAAIEPANAQATADLPDDVADRQSDAPATVEQPEGIATGQTLEQVAAAGPCAAAPESQPTIGRSVELSTDIRSDVSIAPDTPVRPASGAS